MDWLGSQENRIMIFLDFETYSDVNIRDVGAHVYAAHPSTRMLCMAWAIDDSAPQIWRPGTPFPVDLSSRFRDGLEIAWAWNAAFERLIFARFFPKRPVPTRWACSQALAASCGLPLSLGACAAFLAPHDKSLQKDARGEELIQLCSVPGKDGKRPAYTPALQAEMEAYCMQDVIAERGVHHALPVKALSARERALWAVDQTINQRGFLVDKPFIHGANALRASERIHQGAQLAAMTQKAVTAPTQIQRLVAWVRSRGVSIASGSAEHVLDCLALKPPRNVARALQLRQVGSLTSLGKLSRFLTCTSADGRARGSFHFNGAQVTGRWAGRLGQPQNIPRPDRDLSHLIPSIRTADAETIRLMAGDVSLALKDCLRHVIIAKPGYILAVCDINAVEARVAGLVANEPGYLETFRTGKNLYKQTAAPIYGKAENDIIKPSHEYDVGKAGALSLQYGSGPDSFHAKCKRDGIAIPLQLAQRIVRIYRGLYPAMPAAWRKLEALAIAAVANPGRKIWFRSICYFEYIKGFLRIWLPSGRAIYYARPSIGVVDKGYGPRPTIVVWQDIKGAMRRVHIWGGVLFNNIIQAISRDILAAAMLEIEPFAPIILHAHDEIGSEIPIDGAEDILARMTAVMSATPLWAPGLPLKAESFLSAFYKK